MKLVKTTLLSGITTLARLASGFISLKIVAVIIGPPGVALVGQLMNFITMAGTVASGATNGGVTSFTARYHDDEQQKYRVWHTAVWLSGCLSIVVGLATIIFRNYLSVEFLHSQAYSGVFVAFGCSLLFFVWNQLLLAILNGQGEIAKMTTINTLGSFISLAMSIMLVLHYKVYGALLAIAIVPNIIFFVSLFFVYRTKWFKWSAFFGKFDKKIIIGLSSFTLMTIIGATVTPLQQLLVRNLMIKDLSMNMAGNWQGLQKISDAYLMIVYTAFSTYFLPKFAALKTKAEIRKELFDCYKLIVPFVALSIIVIYFSRNMIIHILYSKAFGDMGQLFFWQLIGDFFKTIAWPMGLIFVSKGKAMVIGFNDILFNCLIVVLSYYLIKIIPIQATVLSFAITYFLWFSWLVILTRKYLDE